MASFPYRDQGYPSCDEQGVQYVLVPVSMQGPPDLGAVPLSLDDFYPPAPAPATWDQPHPAAPFFPSPATDDATFDRIRSNIALALSLQASLQQEVPSPLSPPIYPLEFYKTGTINPESFMQGSSSPDSVALDAYSGSIWAPSASSGQQSPSTCSLGSPAMPTDETFSPPSIPEIFFCSEPTCIESFSHRADLKRHKRRHRQNFRCEQCGKAYADRRALNRHLESKHADFAAQIGIKSEKTCCRKCNYVSRTDNVRRHERTQHSLR